MGGMLAAILTIIHFSVANATIKGYYSEEFSIIKKLKSIGVDHPSFKDLS
jgi:hypothetical protein